MIDYRGMQKYIHQLNSNQKRHDEHLFPAICSLDNLLSFCYKIAENVWEKIKNIFLNLWLGLQERKINTQELKEKEISNKMLIDKSPISVASN